MRISNDYGVADPTKPEVGRSDTVAVPYPWRLHSSQRVSEGTEASACPWRVQPCREQRRFGPRQGTALTAETTVATVTEAIS